MVNQTDGKQSAPPAPNASGPTVVADGNAGTPSIINQASRTISKGDHKEPKQHIET